MKYTVLFEYNLSWNYNKRNIACFEQLFWSLRRSLATISTVTPHFFLTKIKTIPILISFINFSKFHKFFFFFKSKLNEKVAFFYIYFIQKSLYWTQILRPPLLYYNHSEVWYFHILLTMPEIQWILHMLKKNNSQSQFFKMQRAWASLNW